MKQEPSSTPKAAAVAPALPAQVAAPSPAVETKVASPVVKQKPDNIAKPAEPVIDPQAAEAAAAAEPPAAAPIDPPPPSHEPLTPAPLPSHDLLQPPVRMISQTVFPTEPVCLEHKDDKEYQKHLI